MDQSGRYSERHPRKLSDYRSTNCWRYSGHGISAGLFTVHGAKKMKIMDDGTVYLHKGEPCPFKCSGCGNLMPFVVDIRLIVCDKCGLIGTPEDFSDVEYMFRRNQ